MSIKYKILLPLLSMVFFAITTISYLYIHYVEEYIKKTSFEQLESIGSITEDKVDLYIQQMQDKLELFNTRMYLYDKLAEYDKTKSTEIKKIVEDILEFAYSKEEDIIDIVILDANTNIIASKLKEVTSDNSFIQDIRTMTKPTQEIRLLYLNDKTTPLLYLSAPILKDGKLIGTSIFIIKLTYLNQILTKNIEIGRTGEIFMGSKNGNKLILFTPLKFSAYPMYCTNKDFNNYISNQISLANTKHQTIKKALDYRKTPVVLSLHYNKALESVIVVKKDMKELMEPIDTIKNYQFIILFISVVFIILASLLISHNIIKVIKRIVRITSNISNGQLDERIEVSTKDELGVLATSVNRMADFMVNAHSISEAKVIEQTKLLQESNDKLQLNNENLSTIIKSLSHDIKTPLTIINGYLEELDDGLVTFEEIPKVTTILKRETAYLNELTSEVIGYIQSKEILRNKQELIYLKEFLSSEVCPLLRVSKGVELKCEIDETETIMFNRIALKKILINLLHNASKYTKNGSIITKVKDENIIVEDTGIGIDSQFSQTIFEPFFGLDESRNREKNGFGLGLSIASNLAKSNGYTLNLDNSYADGARFILRKIAK
ncbi:sensor histidine kinase [Sulfurimonas sp.]|uniref:sensor histidine kinase n=1 Tax=Sulfurimonas sp. TaxID=2022749 RepID=UPI0039E5255A